MWRRAVVGLAVLVLSAAAAPPASGPTKDQIAHFLDSGTGIGPGRAEPLNGWFEAAKTAVAAQGVDGAARQLAPGYGLSAPEMRELLDLWIGSGMDYLERPEDQPSPALARVRSRFQALIKATDHSPLVVQAAGAVLSDLSECAASSFNSLVDGDAELALAVSRAADCPAWDLAALRMAPGRSFGAMLSAASDGYVKGEEQMAALGWLATSEALAHVAPQDRDQVAARVNRLYLQSLFEAGLTSKAMAQFASLSPTVAALTLSGDLPKASYQVDGQPLFFHASGEDEAPALDIAAAEALAGRTDDARARLAATGKLVTAQKGLACQFARPGYGRGKKVEPCPGDGIGRTMVGLDHVLLLDVLLNHPEDDPYPIAEVLFTGMNGSQSLGVWADVVCRVMADAQYEPICNRMRRATVSTQEDEGATYGDDYKVERDVIAAAQAGGLTAIRADIHAAMAEAREHFGGRGFDWRKRPSIDPLPSRFEQREIPPSFRGDGAPPGDWVKALAPLPAGYQPIRVERDGARVAVVSLSQNYDPTGEVSGGGYWIHLSDDGGRTWRAPLYTGLAELFPYVVKPTSKLPLFDGEALNLAVDIRLLDTASITYPPVGLVTRRKQDDLYLRIPISELTRDSDGDGLTDIAADHLLLTPGQDGEPGFVVGARPPAACSTDGAADQEALGFLLKRMFSVGTGAIIEPADRPPGDGLSALAGWRGAANSLDRPIFVEGPSAGFACIRPDRLMIVYDDKQLERLSRTTPDFHAVSLTVVFNRAHDRGYVVYSTGWSGGTTRLRKTGGRWTMEELESWIS